MAHVTFQTALILIFKCAAILHLAGISTISALSQAELKYEKANVALKIQEHFPASYEEYSMEQFISFLMNTNIGLLSLSSTKIVADAPFRTIYSMKMGNIERQGYICSHVRMSLQLGFCHDSQVTYTWMPYFLSLFLTTYHSRPLLVPPMVLL